MTFITARPAPTPKPTSFTKRLLQWVLGSDYNHRQMRKLRELPPECLKDMGMTRADLDGAFYRGSGRVSAEQARAAITTRAWL